MRTLFALLSVTVVLALFLGLNQTVARAIQ